VPIPNSIHAYNITQNRRQWTEHVKMTTDKSLNKTKKYKERSKNWSNCTSQKARNYWRNEKDEGSMTDKKKWSQCKGGFTQYLSINPSIHPSIHLSIYLSIYLPTYLPTYLSIGPSIHPSTIQSIHQRIYLKTGRSQIIYVAEDVRPEYGGSISRRNVGIYPQVQKELQSTRPTSTSLFTAIRNSNPHMSTNKIMRDGGWQQSNQEGALREGFRTVHSWCHCLTPHPLQLNINPHLGHACSW
jgi:hypothetical protein